MPCLLATALGLSLALAGCSKIALVYDRLPTLASFELGRYVDLTPPQRQMFDAQFDRVWRWHRSTQLPLYAAELRKTAQASQSPLTQPQLDEMSNHAQQLAEVTSRKIVQASAPLIASFDDAQIASMLRQIDRDEDKRRDKARKLSDKDWVEQRYDKAVDVLQDWTGDATPAQRERIRRWARGLIREPIDLRDTGRADFESLLRTRLQPDFEARLQKTMAFEPERGSPENPERQQRESRLAANQILIADLSQTATDAQRAFLRKKLDALAEELDALSREPH